MLNEVLDMVFSVVSNVVFWCSAWCSDRWGDGVMLREVLGVVLGRCLANTSLSESLYLSALWKI